MPSTLSCVMQKIAPVPAHTGRYKLKQPRCQSQAKEMRANSPTAWGAPCSAKEKSPDTAKVPVLLARWISGALGAGMQQPSHKEQEKSAVLQYKEEAEVTPLLHLELSSPCIPLERAGESSRAAGTMSHSALAVMQEPQSHGQRGAKKGHYSQPDMDEPSLTHALGKHCSLCSVILFHIPLILITFSFSHLLCWLPGKWSNAFSWELPTCITNRFFFQDTTEPHFAINNLQIHTIKS